MRAVLALLLATASAFRAPLPTRVRAAPRAALPDTLLLLAEATADTKATVTEAVGAEVYGPIFFGGCVPRARARPPARGNGDQDGREHGIDSIYISVAALAGKFSKNRKYS